MTILFVCGGNTCRSPMAAGMAAAKWSLPVSSVGIDPGPAVTAHAIAAVRLIAGVDISGHRPRAFNAQDLSPADILVVLDEYVAAEVLRALPVETPIVLRPVPDPFGGDLERYMDVANHLREVIERLTPLATVAFAMPVGSTPAATHGDESPQALRARVIDRRRRLDVAAPSHKHGLASSSLTAYEPHLKRLLAWCCEHVEPALAEEVQSRQEVLPSQGTVLRSLGALRKSNSAIAELLPKPAFAAMNALVEVRNRLAHETSPTLHADAAQALELLEQVMDAPIWRCLDDD